MQLSEMRKEKDTLVMEHSVELKSLEKLLAENTSFYYDMFNKLHLHVSCLGCDQIKPETMVLICGHNICKTCLNKYSSTEHPRSSIRCDVCLLETKVVLLSVSIPNRAVCDILIEC